VNATLFGVVVEVVHELRDTSDPEEDITVGVVSFPPPSQFSFDAKVAGRLQGPERGCEYSVSSRNVYHTRCCCLLSYIKPQRQIKILFKYCITHM
jgi:hypothetical protein